MWGPTGWDRLFLPEMGGQISWLLPAALVLGVAGLIVTRRAPRTDRRRAAFLLWGGILVVTGATISFSQGIIHPYYTVALAPAIGALVGMGSVTLWERRESIFARLAMATTVLATAVWGWVLLDRSPSWFPALRWAIVVGGLAAAAMLVLPPRFLRKWVAAGVVAAVVVALAGPTAYSLDTAASTHSGSLPSAGPSVAGGAGPGGGPGGQGGAGGLPGQGGPGGATGLRAPGAARTGQGFPGAPGVAAGRTAGRPGATGGVAGGTGTGGAGRTGGAAGGLLNGSTPSAALVRLLQTDAGRYRWVAATTGSNSASGYQLDSGDPVMAIGGFNGTDPAPTLAQFERYVRDGDIHYYLGGGGSLGGGQGGSGDATAISTWVAAHYTAKTVGGVTVYDLTQPKAT
jgi:4-amino-4-deoxy-L-arabinose transferase-like glycosyltransferase